MLGLGNCWNGGEFYGPPDNNSLVLLEKYFEKYPEDADKVFISIKGGVNPATHKVDGSPENTRRSLDNSIAQLKGRKKIDLFEFGRRDPEVPMSVTFGVIEKEYIQTGKLGGISLSEVSAETIHEAVKYAKIAAVEVELSMYVNSGTNITLNALSNLPVRTGSAPTYCTMASPQRVPSTASQSSPTRRWAGAC